MKILLFGANGMLGKYVHKILCRSNNCIISMTRKDFNIDIDNVDDINLENIDVVINCAGIIPQKENNLRKFIRVNSIFPNLLNEKCKMNNIKFIHITTDCVFSGKKGNYDENDIHDENSPYGISKSCGEPKDACIIRTSIIGENETSESLLEWAKSQKNQKIKGYTNHFWNGVTCFQLAEIINEIISKNLYWTGVRHIFSNQILTKYELLKIINDVYNLNLKIEPYKTSLEINRSLKTNFQNFKIPPILEQIKIQKNRGEYNNLKCCRFCKGEIQNVFHLGDDFPLAGGFLRYLEDEEFTYPLTLVYCERCSVLQCKEIINPEILFKSGYFYYSSMIPMLVDHFENYANVLFEQYGCDKTIVEIGCNDGVFLRPLKKKGFKVIGVDPSDTVNTLISENFEIYNDFFNEQVVEKIIKTHGKIDIFLSSNSFAHIDDMSTIFKCIKLILKSEGTAIIEVHNSKSIIDDLHFDFIYHEHMTYYTLTSFVNISKLFDMSIVDVEQTNIHGNSIRVYIKNIPNQPYSNNVDKLLKEEIHLTDTHSYIDFSHNINIWRNEFSELIETLKKDGNSVYGYGASGRSNILSSYCNIDFDEIIDDAPSKIGLYTPIFHKKVISSEILKTDPPDYLVILAFAYSKNIIEKHSYFRGKFIIPLPTIQIIDGHDIFSE